MKTWTKEEIKDLLKTNDKAVERALLALLERQTEDERNTESTRHTNNRGFTQADARIFTSMAKQVKRGYSLSAKQLGFLRNGKSERYPSRIGKYAGQLAEIANLKEQAKSAPTQAKLPIGDEVDLSVELGVAA